MQMQVKPPADILTRDNGRELRENFARQMAIASDTAAEVAKERAGLTFAKGVAAGVLMLGLAFGVALQEARSDAAYATRELDRMALDALVLRTQLEGCATPSRYVPHVLPLPVAPQARK